MGRAGVNPGQGALGGELPERVDEPITSVRRQRDVLREMVESGPSRLEIDAGTVDGAAPRRFGGGGLGRNVAENPAGIIRAKIPAEGNPWRGSTFSVSLAADREASPRQ